MNILLTNDDGINAPGIEALHRTLTNKANPLGEVFTVAPASVQSATSHGITYHIPLMVEQSSINNQPALAVEGRPADCTKLALTNLYPEKFGTDKQPDLVISGMNSGANCGINVIYSGTVAAAIEAAFIGVPAIAVSLHMDSDKDNPNPDWDRAAQAARKTIDTLLKDGLPNTHEVLSINIPATQYLTDNTKAVVCPMNTHALVDQYEKRATPKGSPYYWSTAHGLTFHSTDIGTDVYELFQRNITITPLTFDLTDHSRINLWKDRTSANDNNP